MVLPLPGRTEITWIC